MVKKRDPRRERRRFRKSRAQRLELLEPRLMLNADWQNPARPLDVNNDVAVTTLDALLILNQLQRTRSAELPERTNRFEPYFDTTGDEQITPLDALIILNALARNSEEWANGLPRVAGESEIAPAGFFSKPLTVLPGTTGQLVEIFTTLTIGEKEFNEFGLFVTDDPDGTVNGIAPSSSAYPDAVFGSNSRRVLYSKRDIFRSSREVVFPGGQNVHVYVLQGMTRSDDPDAHIRVLELGDSDLQVGWDERSLPIDSDESIQAYDDATVDLRIGQPFVANDVPALHFIPDQTIPELVELNVQAIAVDANFPNDSLVYSFDSAPDGATLDPQTGLFRWLPTEAQGPGTHAVTIRVTDSQGAFDTESFAVHVQEINSPPVLELIANRVLRPQAAVNFNALATDLDIPANVLTFSLDVGLLHGAGIDPQTGLFQWVAPEVSVTTDFPFTVRVSDNGTPCLSALQSFTITVDPSLTEHPAPVVVPIEDQVVAERSELLLQVIATAAGFPDALLSYSLDAAPPGAMIDPISGWIAWTPTEAQGPGNYTIEVRVADPAGSYSTVAFDVEVLEVNQPPTLDPIADLTVSAGVHVSFTAQASDPDLPANTLTFLLDSGAPADATIDPQSGYFSWTAPIVETVTTFLMTARVRDDGSPILDDARSFMITVNPPQPECPFDDLLSGWQTSESGGSESGRGSVAAVECSAVIGEGDSFRTELSRPLTLTADLRAVELRFDSPQFDVAASEDMQDAFEVSVTNAAGELLTQPFRPGRTAAFNWSERSEPVAGRESRFTPASGDQPHALLINLAHLDAGTEVTVTARLLNNDSDDGTSILIRDLRLASSPGEASPSFDFLGETTRADGPLFIDQLEDISGSVLLQYEETSYTLDRSQIITELVLDNIGNRTLIGDLVIAIDRFSEFDTFAMRPDGWLPDGRPYFDLTPHADGPLRPGQSTISRELRFTNPAERRFDFRITTYGRFNDAPDRFIGTPLTEIEAGRTYRYTATAIDNDGDALTFSIVSGPESMTIDAIGGELFWETSADDVARHTVTLRATDPFGLFVEQSFAIDVVASLQNRPPNFVSVPVTDAIASSGFEITTVAVGPSPSGIGILSGFRGPRLVSANAGDQTISVHAGQNDDRFDDTTVYSTGEPRPTGRAIDVGYSVDIGLPPFLVPNDTNEVLGMDQGDFNGDGILDLVVLTSRNESTKPQGQRLTIEITRMLGDGNGNFGPPTVIATIPAVSNSLAKHVAVADLDGDGHPDVIAIEELSSRLITVRGLGNGEFEPAVLTTLNVALNDFRLFDLDGDGRLDIVGRNGNISDLGWMRGLGDGTFAAFDRLADGGEISVGASNYSGRPYDFADLNSDGHVDIVIGEYNSGNVVVLLNDGDQNFTSALTIDPPGGNSGPLVLHVADFTGDGELDILTVSSWQRRVDLFIGDGSGTEFTHRPGVDVFNLAGNAAGSDGPVDVNGDGHLDIVLTNVGTNDATSPQVLINDGEGNFTRADYPMLEFPGHASVHNQTNLGIARGAMFGDYNRDGVSDLVYMTGGNDFNGVGVRLGTRPGEFGSTRTISGATQDLGDREVHAADFDGDGIADLLVLRSATMLLGNGDGTFADPFPAAPVSGAADSGAVADFNLDGIPDYVAHRSSGGSRFYVGLGNGDGTFEVINGPLSGHFYGYDDIRIEDINGNGYPDIIAKAGVERVIDVFLNDPENPGNFERTFTANFQASGVLARGYQNAFATGDFDGDGLIDFVAADQDPGEPIKLMTFAGLGDGTFNLTNETFAYNDEFYPGGFYRPNVLQSGDVNGDGILDVVSFTSHGAVIHLGQGDGTFTTIDHYPYESFNQDTKDGFLVDFDQDGNLDLVYYGIQQALNLRRGFGDGTFSEPERVGLIGGGDALTFADLDNDGHLDIAMVMTFAGNYNNEDIVFYFGARDGLVDQLAVDLDGDGNEEVLAINEANDRLKLFVGDNLDRVTRQVDLFTGRAPRAVTTGDLNGDGQPEIITANRAGRSISVFSGSVADGYHAVEISVGSGPIDVQTADTNNDGILDVLVLDDSANALWVLNGNADGTLADPVAIPLGDKPGRFAVVDATGDGQLNAVITLPQTDRVMILHGLDLRPDAPPPIYVQLDSSPGDVVVTDLNFDGRPDLAVTLPEENRLSLHYGLGASQFARSQRIAVGERPARVSLADADQDGRIDLIVANAGDGTASVIYNRFDPNEVYRYDSEAIDPDDDPLIYSIVDGPGGLIINSETGELFWAASPDQVGVHDVTIQADDGRGGIGSQSFKIDVRPARDNAAPLFATEPQTSIGAGETFRYQSTALDQDGDALRYRLLEAPKGASIDPTTGEVTWDARSDLAVDFAPHGITSTGRIEVSADPSLQPVSLTVEAWFNFTSLPANNSRSNLIGQPGVGSGFAYSLTNLSNSHLRLQMDFGGASPSLLYSVPFVPQTGRWYHIALTLDDASRTATIFVDGAPLGTTAIPEAIHYDPQKRAVIGDSGAFFSRATLDNYRLWNVARTPAEIVEGMSRHYERDSRVVLDYRFDLPNTLTVRDHSPAGNHGHRIANGLLPPLVPGLANPGLHHFMLGVDDGRGGFDTQTFALEVLPELRGSIHGQLFDDLDGDGVRDTDELVLSGWHLFIDANDNGFPDPHELQVTTDAQGNYRFDGLLPGEYPLRISPVAGYETPPVNHVSVTANAVQAIDLAIEQLSLGQIHGRLLTEEDAAIAHWRVFADLDGDGFLGDDEPVATSDREGNFALTGLAAGTYPIRPELPAGWEDVAGRDGLTVALAADEIATQNDFVLRPATSSVSGGVNFVTKPTTTIEARQTFRYASIAMGLFDEAIRYDLSLAPAGMTIDPATGLVVWRPSIDQVGQHPVILRATSDFGSIAFQDFSLAVNLPNTAPVLSGRPPAIAYSGLTYAADLTAQDAEFHTVSFELLSGPDTATLDSTTGKLRWIPTANGVGTVSFSIELRDQLQGTSIVEFEVEVVDGQPGSTPFLITMPRTQVGLGQHYLSQIRGTDAIDRPLTWSLLSGPSGLEVDVDGTLQWMLAIADLGDHPVALQASDIDGGTEVVLFSLRVVGRTVNSAPQVISMPPVSTVIGSEYRYDVRFTDADSDPVTFDLLAAPVGMSLHPSLGTVRWTPAVDQIGESEITIEVTDPDGRSATQTFKLTVSRVGGPPIIQSIPPTEASVGVSYLHTVAARDAEGDPLTYRLLAAPAGMTIVETTGEIAWTPLASQLGQQDVVIEVIDGIGGAATQAFTIRVDEGVPNMPPRIISEAPRFAVVGGTYEYHLEATDPEATTVTYSLGQAPAGMTVDPETGLVSWLPSAGQAGEFVVTLIATDAGGASAVESFQLDVLAENRAPIIVSHAPSEVMAGVRFIYQVIASDVDLDPLAYTLVSAPAGAVLDRFGKLTWPTSGMPLGNHDFTVRVNDPRGGQAVQSFTLSLVPDTEPPKLSLIEIPNDGSRNVLPWQGPFKVHVRATDNVEVAAVTLVANGQDIPLDAAGTATFTFEDWTFQRINATATAVDTSGNATTRTISFDYDFPEGWSGAGVDDIPIASITSPSDTETVFGMVSIVGTASHENFDAYKLSYRRIDQTEYSEILQSDTPVENGQLGLWDTSLLINDEYVIRLEVATSSGVVNVVEHHVGLAGELKLGNFRLAFTDINFSLAGIPLEITRIYDTLQADREGDFGYGWRLEYRNTDLRVGLPKSGLEDIGIYSPMRPGVKVFLNVPGQGRQGFTFNPDTRVLPGFGGNNLVVARPRFTPDPGVTSVLSAGTSSYLQVNEYGELYAPGNIPYNPASPHFSGGFRLTTKEGLTYQIDGASGNLTSIRDANGNVAHFTESSIRYRETEILIDRDGSGRIIRITDPQEKSIAYQYDGGTLSRVVDREFRQTTFQYLSERPHFLDAVVDPLGREGLRQQYNETGRLAGISRMGEPVFQFTFDPANAIAKSTDTRGHEFVLEYDNRGNVVSETDSLGNRTQFAYDAKGQQISRTDALGNVFSSTYDAGGNLTRSIDPLGNVTHRSYTSNRLTTIVDRVGNRTSFEYDVNGNITQETFANGYVRTYVYDQQGNLVQVRDGSNVAEAYAYDSQSRVATVETAAGLQKSFSYDGNGQVSAMHFSSIDAGLQVSPPLKFLYDGEGNLIRTSTDVGIREQRAYDALDKLTSRTDANGQTTSYFYATNDALSEIRTPDGGTQFLDYSDNQIRSRQYQDGSLMEYEYDAMGRVVAEYVAASADGDRTLKATYDYDAVGRLIATRNADGNETTYTYDSLGRLISVRDPLGNLSHREYDAEGRLTRVTSALGHVTLHEYDPIGNLVSKRWPDGPEVRMEYDLAGNLRRHVDENGVATAFSYDPAGNLTGVIDAAGGVTRYSYTELGKLASQIDAMGRETNYFYDDRGNHIVTRYPDGTEDRFEYDSADQLIGSSDASGRTTVYVYDQRGRLVERRYADGSTHGFELDGRGRVIRSENRHGETEYQFDSTVGLVERTDANGNRVQYEYTSAGRTSRVTVDDRFTQYEYDAAGRMVAAIDDEGRVTRLSYDADGNLVAREFPNGMLEERAYSERGLLTRLSQSLGGQVIASYDYALDPTGRILSVSELDGRHTEYVYDSLYRLVEEVVHEAGEAFLHRTFEYDAVGNRLRVNDLVSGKVEAFTYDEMNRLLSRVDDSQQTQYFYDESGRQVLEVTNGTTVKAFVWDAAGQLSAVSVTDGAITRQVVYAFDLEENVISRSQDGLTERYVYDTTIEYAALLAAQDSFGTTFYATNAAGLTSLDDGQQRTSVLPDGQGNHRQFWEDELLVSQAVDYDAFGNSVAVDFPLGLIPLYNGELRDGLVGIDFLGERQYDPDQARFLSADSFVGYRELPMSLNRYAYAHNDPVNANDPSGNNAVGIGIGGLLAVFAISTLLGKLFSNLLEAPKSQAVKAHLGPSVNEAHRVAVEISNDLWIGNHYPSFSSRTMDAYHRRHVDMWEKIAIGLTPGSMSLGFLSERAPSVSEDAVLQISGESSGYQLLAGGDFARQGTTSSSTAGNEGGSPEKIGFVITAMAEALNVQDYSFELAHSYRLPQYLSPIGIYNLNTIGRHGMAVARG